MDFEIKPIYIDAKTINQIYQIETDSILPYIYTHIPDLSTLDSEIRKRRFIDIILPAILIEKAKVKKAYNYIKNEFDNIDLSNTDTQNTLDSLYTYCHCKTKHELLLCLSDQPTSIIIAQAAIESAWGTSRFFLEGFNLFGIHSYSNNDQRIEAHGSENSLPIYVKKYDNILSSVSDYLRILATGDSYIEFRIRRLSADTNIVMYLTKYSERRELYTNDITSIINYNNLYQYNNLTID